MAALHTELKEAGTPSSVSKSNNPREKKQKLLSGKKS